MSLRDELIEVMAAAICFESGDPMTETKSHTGSATVALELALSHLEAHGLQIVRRDDFYNCVQAASANVNAFSSQNEVVNEIVKAAFATSPNPLAEEQNDD